MKKTKILSRLFAGATSLALAAGMLSAVPAAAATENVIYSTQTVVTAGETEHIPIYIKGNTGFDGFVVYLTYDPQVITPVDVDDSEGLIAGMTENSIGGYLADLKENTVKVVYAGYGDDAADDGLLFNFECEINSEAEGSTVIEVDYSPEETYDSNIDDVVFNCENVTLDIKNNKLDSLPAITFSADDTVAGGKTALSAELSNSGSLSSADLTVSYDADKLVCRDVVPANNAVIENLREDVSGEVSFTVSGIGNVKDGSKLFDIVFSAKDSASGKCTVSGTAEGVNVRKCSFDIASGENSGKVSVTTQNGIYASKGEMFTVPFYFSGANALMGYQLRLRYDETQIKAVSVKDNNLFKGSFSNNILDGLVIVNWADSDGHSESGKVFEVTFEVLTDEEVDTQIKVEYQQDDTFDESYSDVEMICEDPSVSLNSPQTDELNITGAALTLQNNIAVKFVVAQQKLEAFDSPYMEIEFEGQTSRLSTYTLKDTNCMFAFMDISPDHINSTIKARLYGYSDGKLVYGSQVEYSIARYCYNMLEKWTTDEDTELRTLMVDILNYGTAAQNYTGFNVSAPANENLTAVQRSWATSDIDHYDSALDPEYESASVSTVEWSGASLSLGSSIKMNFVFTTSSIEELSVKVRNADGKVIGSFTSADFANIDTDTYSVKFAGIKAGQLKDKVYVTVYNGDTAVSDTLQYSVESYAASAGGESDQMLSELVHAMMKYGASANAYAKLKEGD